MGTMSALVPVYLRCCHGAWTAFGVCLILLDEPVFKKKKKKHSGWQEFQQTRAIRVMTDHILSNADLGATNSTIFKDFLSDNYTITLVKQ